jgi:hypothetical protein
MSVSGECSYLQGYLGICVSVQVLHRFSGLSLQSIELFTDLLPLRITVWTAVSDL